jgi:hypothetical protein
VSNVPLSNEQLKEIVNQKIDNDEYELVIKNGLLFSLKFKIKE